jgi:DNA-binding response OmpR family regulator
MVLCADIVRAGKKFYQDHSRQKSSSVGTIASSRYVAWTVYIRRIREKVELEPHNPTYVQTVHGVGCQFAATAD